MHKVELKILTSSDVPDPIRIFLSQFSHDLQLLRIDPAKRNLDALHAGCIPESVGTFGRPGFTSRELQSLSRFAIPALTIIIALTVGSASQTRLSKQLLIELALFAQFDLGLVDLDFP